MVHPISGPWERFGGIADVGFIMLLTIYILSRNSPENVGRMLDSLLRVAQPGLVLIEPQEVPLLESPCFILKRVVKAALIRLGLGRRLLRRSETGLLAPWMELKGLLDKEN